MENNKINIPKKIKPATKMYMGTSIPEIESPPYIRFKERTLNHHLRNLGMCLIIEGKKKLGKEELYETEQKLKFLLENQDNILKYNKTINEIKEILSRLPHTGTVEKILNLLNNLNTLSWILSTLQIFIEKLKEIHDPNKRILEYILLLPKEEIEKIEELINKNKNLIRDHPFGAVYIGDPTKTKPPIIYGTPEHIKTIGDWQLYKTQEVIYFSQEPFCIFPEQPYAQNAKSLEKVIHYIIPPKI